MRTVTAILLPWLTFFSIGRPLAGACCLLLQLTLFGWLPAAIWAFSALSRYNNHNKIHRAVVRLS